MRTERITLRIAREDEEDGLTGAVTAPVREWDWPKLLDCQPEHVEVADTRTVTMVLRLRDENAATAAIDSLNEWARHPEIEPLLERVPHPLLGEPDIPADATEPDYSLREGET